MTSETTQRDGVPTPRAVEQPVADASTGDLVRRLSTQLSDLVRGELELARTELTEKGKRAGAGAAGFGAAGVVALFGVGALVAAAIAGLATVLDVWLSALIIGGVLLLVAGLLAVMGRSQIRRATPPMPERAVEGVKRDVETVNERMHR
jgi:uncharacterized membrane protein YqjE